MKKIKGGITAPRGFLASGVKAGIKESGRDVALIYSQELAAGAAVFTTNQVQAAPVKLSRKNCEDGKVKAVIVNSGNANACTGKKGLHDAREMIKLTAEELKLKEEELLVASTGIIGEELPMEKIRRGIKKAVDSLAGNAGSSAAEAIMTTDDFKKEVAVEFEVEGEIVRLGGIAKGSGMIEPDMATMLSFLTTDLAVEHNLLKEALREAVDNSFNKITVDGDQSTNDTVAILANGQAGSQLINKKGEAYNKFLKALKYVTEKLAKKIVRDGEGATKFIEIEIKGAGNDKEAEKIAKKIANSKLVKTALFGEDPNWGRIAAAVGAAEAEVKVPKLEIIMNGVSIFGPEEEVHAYPEDLLTPDEIKIEVNLNIGEGSSKVWTCDLSYEYVEINAEYHT